MTILYTRGQGGAGFEAAGDPLGGGGTLHVVRARAVEGQTVRVVFSAEPRHLSAASQFDALTPSNYGFTVLLGTAIAPQPVGVKPELVTYPAPGLLDASEYGVDVAVDRPMVAGLRFRVTAHGIVSRAGDPLGFPYSADFSGMVPLAKAAPKKSGIGYMDIATDLHTGALVVDSSGDLANHTGMDSLRKRVRRRQFTPKGAFSWLKNYGVGIDAKKPMTVNRLMRLKVDLAQQVRMEPEVADCSSTLSKPATSALKVQLQVKTKTGAILPMTATVDQNGGISVS